MKERLLMLLFILIIGSVLTSALIVVDSVTAPTIERNEEVKLKSSILEAFSVSFGPEEVESAFDGSVQILQRGENSIYRTVEGEEAFEFDGSGLWGPIRGIVALDADLRHIKGVTIIYQEETPGLGSRIADAEHLSKFEGRIFESGLNSVAAGRSSGSQDIDAISGATLSSDAFIDILNRALAEFAALAGGENK